jgi:hypothetical protein
MAGEVQKLTPLDWAKDKSKRPKTRADRGIAWLYDSKHWMDALGRTVLIEEMDPEHARNAKNLLLRQRRMIVRALSWRMSMEAAMHDGGDMAQDALDQVADELLEAELSKSHKPAVDVIKRLPVFKALKRQARRKR